jgi:hypothetical protein
MGDLSRYLAIHLLGVSLRGRRKLGSVAAEAAAARSNLQFEDGDCFAALHSVKGLARSDMGNKLNSYHVTYVTRLEVNMAMGQKLHYSTFWPPTLLCYSYSDNCGGQVGYAN